jgi:hypothetical protein
VGFLCKPTKEDIRKLRKVLGYLIGTKDWKMKMRPKDVFSIVAYIDASFSAHPDGKSHSRVVMRVGGVSVLFSPKKQKCVSKSHTEAEHVALSDNIGFVELFGELVNFMLNEKSRKLLVYQDNNSVIDMMVSRGGITRMKHMRTRMHLILEAVKEHRIGKKHIIFVKLKE